MTSGKIIVCLIGLALLIRLSSRDVKMFPDCFLPSCVMLFVLFFLIYASFSSSHVKLQQFTECEKFAQLYPCLHSSDNAVFT